jgi:hypothetical protein
MRLWGRLAAMIGLGGLGAATGHTEVLSMNFAGHAVEMTVSLDSAAELRGYRHRISVLSRQYPPDIQENVATVLTLALEKRLQENEWDLTELDEGWEAVAGGHNWTRPPETWAPLRPSEVRTLLPPMMLTV